MNYKAYTYCAVTEDSRGKPETYFGTAFGTSGMEVSNRLMAAIKAEKPGSVFYVLDVALIKVPSSTVLTSEGTLEVSETVYDNLTLVLEGQN